MTAGGGGVAEVRQEDAAKLTEATNLIEATKPTEAAKPTEECEVQAVSQQAVSQPATPQQAMSQQAQQAMSQQAMSQQERRLRIVHSADRSAGFLHRPLSQPPARPAAATPAATPAHSNAQSNPKSEVMLDRAIRGHIGTMLRDVFDDVANEPVPERFVALLEALGAWETKR